VTDDIVTRLRNGDPICLDGHIYKSWAIEAADEIERLRADRDRWKAQADRLGTHLGEGLYTDDWECREYAIAAYSDWERQPESHLYKYDVEPQIVWYFKEGKSI
jgi:hypothetical protein